MPDARPFRALRYTAKPGAIEDLVAPPYDVMTSEERAVFAAKSPYNVVHLILPEGDADPSAPGNRYDRAGELLGEWLAAGVVAAEDEPSVTVVRERFEAGGREHVRTGVELALRLDAYGAGGAGAVYPHEQTLDKPKADRLALMRSTKANLGPVFALVPDGDGALRNAIAECSAHEPDFRLAGPDDATRHVWIEREARRLEGVQKALEGRHAVIADGHHRYETALAYRDEVVSSRGTTGGTTGAPAAGTTGATRGGADRILCHVVPIEDPGLVVLPTHRVVRPGGTADEGAFWSKLGEHFTLEETTRERAIEFAKAPPESGDGQAFVVAAGRPPKLRLAALRDASIMNSLAPDRAEAWRRLDVTCLHRLVIEDALGVAPDEVASGTSVSYSHSARSVIAAVENEGVLGFILRPTPPRSVLAVARAGEKMPQKSTYFYPKVAAGLAMRLL